MSTNDPINPNQYKTNSGIECIDIAQHFPYTLGNAIKYAWRAGQKDDLIQDLEKSLWYMNKTLEEGYDFVHPYDKEVSIACRKLSKLDPDEFNHYDFQWGIIMELVSTDVEEAKRLLEMTIKELKSK